MIRAALYSILLFSLSGGTKLPGPGQDIQVVTYFTGKAGTDTYMGLSFWIKDDARAYIRYAHAQDTTDIDLIWKGIATIGGSQGFLANFPPPDTTSWFITPQGLALRLADRSGNYLRTLRWENENLSTGDSTAGPARCTICAANEKEAMKLMQHFFR